MMQYHYDIIHVSGKDLHTADFFSREPPLKETGSDELRNEVDLCSPYSLNYQFLITNSTSSRDRSSTQKMDVANHWERREEEEG